MGKYYLPVAISVFVISILTAFSFSRTNKTIKLMNGGSDGFALVELFTSQGCSSCPAADQLLSKTIAETKRNGNNVLALSFHVDYWNRLGWKDPFSDSRYSDRQRSYAEKFGLNSVYTPQAVVNGNKEFVGSDDDRLDNAIKASLQEKSAASFKSINTKMQKDQCVKVKFELEGDYGDCFVNIALISLSETTSVKKGENAGENLKSENIVRQFKSITATAIGEVDLNASPMPTANNRAIVAYIQRRSDLRIIGAVQSPVN